MKKSFIVCSALLSLTTVNPSLAFDATSITSYSMNRFSIGARLNHRTFIDSDSGHKGGRYESGTYLGTIYAIDEVQNHKPFLFAAYDFSPYLSIELAYDKIEGETLATSIQNPDTGTKSDGDISLTGFTLNLYGSLPNESNFIPYIGLGVGYYKGDFEETAHWGLGYLNEPHHAASGYSDTLYNGHKRWMEIDNSIAFLFTAGSKYTLPYNCYLDASIQYIMVDADGHFKYSDYGIESSKTQNGTFPLDNISFRLGIGYRF